MEIFLLEDLGEQASASVPFGGLLEEWANRGPGGTAISETGSWRGWAAPPLMLRNSRRLWLTRDSLPRTLPAGS